MRYSNGPEEMQTIVSDNLIAPADARLFAQVAAARGNCSA